MRCLACVVFLIMPWASAVGAPQIGYANATGYYKKDSRPTLYQPLNLLDGRESTCWCSTTADFLAETLTFGFKGIAKIDEIRIYTGNGFDDRTFQEFGRGKKFLIKAPGGTQTLSVADHRGLQAIALRPPLTGSQFTLEILDQYPAEDPETPVCVTDIVFYSEGKPLNGSWLTQKLKYDKNRSLIQGTWFTGPEGAADRFLSFFFDGTYRFSFEPYDPEAKGHSFGGAYDASASHLTLELPGRGKLIARMRRERKEDPSGRLTQTLVLEGNLPEELKLVYRDHL